MDNTAISYRVTSDVVLLNGWMDLDTMVATQRRETARVLDCKVPQPSPVSIQFDPPPREY